MSSSIVYDGWDFAGYLHVEAVRRPLMAERAADTESRPRGARLESVASDPKTIEVDVRLVARVRGRARQREQLEQLRRLVAGKLLRDEPCKLVLPDAPDLYDMAVLDGSTDLERVSCTSKATLSFLCPDPRSWGETGVRQMEQGGEVTCLVGGNDATAPVVAVVADGPFTVLFDGVPFDVLGAPVGLCGIDAEEHAVACGGLAVRYSIMSDFPEWAPGVHRVECDRPYAVRWCDRWL